MVARSMIAAPWTLFWYYGPEKQSRCTCVQTAPVPVFAGVIDDDNGGVKLRTTVVPTELYEDSGLGVGWCVPGTHAIVMHAYIYACAHR